MIEALLLGGPKNGEIIALQHKTATIHCPVMPPLSPLGDDDTVMSFETVVYRHIGSDDGFEVYEAP